MFDFDTLTPEQKTKLQPFSPHARFEIPSEKTGRQYLAYLQTLLLEMLKNADKRNHERCFTFGEKSGEEGGVGMLYLNEELITGFKLYWYDGNEGTPLNWKKGLLLRDHEDKGVYTVHQIFCVATAFAESLAARKITFTLLVRHREGRAEIEGCKVVIP